MQLGSICFWLLQPIAIDNNLILTCSSRNSAEGKKKEKEQKEKRMSEEKSKLAIEEVKFLPNGADDATKGGDVEKGAKRAVNNGAFVGLTKEELQQFADDPYWVSFESVVLSVVRPSVGASVDVLLLMNGYGLWMTYALTDF